MLGDEGIISCGRGAGKSMAAPQISGGFGGGSLRQQGEVGNGDPLESLRPIGPVQFGVLRRV